jgi:CheY-like chemotaxis protein
MWFESVSGVGSTFFFTVTPEWMAPRQKAFVSADRFHIRGKHLLIVEDNENNRRILSTLAKKWGMNCTMADSGRNCLDLFHAGQHFDVAILDMQMPGMDGIMLARAIRALPRSTNLPLILLSSIGRTPAPEVAALFSCCLTKPAKPSQIFNELGRALGHEEINETPATPVVPLLTGETRSESILLAEDNAVNQKVAIHMLARLGYRADVAGNGLETIQALKRRPYDIVLMDVQMPEMDGLEATRQIRKDTSLKQRPWIIALTANAMEGDAEKCREAGMDDYLGKPIKKQDLEAVLNHARLSLIKQRSESRRPF